MQRIFLGVPGRPIEFRFLDSVHAAIVSGLTVAGAKSEEVVGQTARVWTFAVKGYAKEGGRRFLSGLTISTPDPVLAEQVKAIIPAAISARSVNGDVVTLAGATKTVLDDPIAPGQTEFACVFASPFVVSKQKTERSKTEFVDVLDGIDLSSAFSAGLTKRAGREIRIEVAVDGLTLATQGERSLVATRLHKGRKVILPAFNLPVTLRGSEMDLRYAYFGGLGSKTRTGFGCPAKLR